MTNDLMTNDQILGGLAQLARAPALHAGGQRFESVILHQEVKSKVKSQKPAKAMTNDPMTNDYRTFFDILEEVK